jgi:hypothetical protein
MVGFLFATSGKGTKPLPEERSKTSGWIPVGRTEKQICATFRQVTRWDNNDTTQQARSMGRPTGVLEEYDRA